MEIGKLTKLQILLPFFLLMLKMLRLRRFVQSVLIRRKTQKTYLHCGLTPEFSQELQVGPKIATPHIHLNR